MGVKLGSNRDVRQETALGGWGEDTDIGEFGFGDRVGAVFLGRSQC